MTGNSPSQASANEALEKILDYSFKDRELLTKALSHASAISRQRQVLDTYQRLEFVGDRVLALIISKMLYQTYQSADEGELARRLNHLVMRDTCAAVAVDAGIGDFIILGDGEIKTGGRKKVAILADVCESVIAALYVDGGLEIAERFIEQNWRSRMEAGSGSLSDAKTTLQEWVQSRGFEPPRYDVRERTGPDHAPNFTITVQVDGEDPIDGMGKSKREAEQAAATALLVRVGIWDQNNG